MQRLAGFVLLLLGCVPPTGVVAELRPPPGRSLHAARVETFFETRESRGSHGFLPSSFEMSAVELVIDERLRVVLDSRFLPAPGFGEASDVRTLIAGPFAVASAPDGAWLAVSSNGGAAWRLVEPATPMTSARLELPGPLATLWARAPTPARAAADILRAVGKPHPPSGDPNASWPEHPRGSDEEQASAFALAHAGDPALRAAVLDALASVPDNVQGSLGGNLTRLVVASAQGDPSVRGRLAALLERPWLNRASAVVRVSDALVALGDPEVDDRVAGWASRALAPPAPLAAAFKDTMTGWAIATVWWGMARRAFEHGHAGAAPTAAARAWLTRFASAPPQYAPDSWDTDPDPWRVSMPEQGALCYAVMLLGLAGDRVFLDGLPRQRRAAKEAWPPRFTGGSVDDGRTGPQASFNVSGWIEAARSAIARSAP